MITPAFVESSAQVERAREAAAKTAGGHDERLYSACQDFEAIFVKQLLKAMDATLQKDGPLDGGYAQRLYDDMLLDEYAAKISKTAKLGIAELMYSRLKETRTGTGG
jgi:flagellar protein FlgJ